MRSWICHLLAVRSWVSIEFLSTTVRALKGFITVSALWVHGESPNSAGRRLTHNRTLVEGGGW